MAAKPLKLTSAWLLVAALASFGGAGCSAGVGGTTLPCNNDDDCAAGVCDAGECRVKDDGGASLVDAGADDGGSAVDAGVRDDGGPRGDGGQERDAGRVDAGAAGGEQDGGAIGDDAGAPLADGGSDDAGGGACFPGCPGIEHRAPIEVCGDGYDNDCDGSVDEQPCGRARIITVATSASLPPGYSMQVPVSATLLGATDGSDVRVWRFDDDSDGFVEVPRVLDPDESWSSPKTIWFSLAAGALAASEDASYRLTWGSVPSGAGPPLNDEDDVFHFADFFEWGPSDTGAPAWDIVDAPDDDKDIDVEAGALSFVSVPNDQNGSPHASRDFTGLVGGFELDVRFHWTGTDSDDDYAWRLLLGDTTMPAPATNQGMDSTGVGPNLLWGLGSGEFDLVEQQSLAVDEQANGDPVVLATGVQESTRVLIAGDTADKSFYVAIQGGASVNGFAFGSVGVSELSRIRFYPSELTHTSSDEQFSSRRFEHVILRARVATEPSVSLVPPASCL